jgi:acyl-CoA synthetase (AMP-forming)/AMP-acid ligase II
VCERAEDPDMQRCQTAVCLRAECSIDYLVTYFALHRAGCVVVPLEKDIPEDTFQELSQHFSASSVPENIADILYTTGTTGKSKGVMISHQTIIADAENLISGQGFTHDLAFIVNGPLNHIGSLSKIYPVIMLGATLILVDGMKDLNAFWKAFDYPALKVATFLVPASIRILIQFCPEQLASYAEKIDFIETGAAAISQADMETLCRLLPKSRLYNTYASTETGIISTYNFNDGKCVAGCLGRPMPHSQVFITSEGHIACKGDTLMSGYVGDPERTATVLRDGVVYTSDIGRIDEKGMLHLSGREDDVINVGGFKVAPTEVEDAAMAFPDIQDCICISVEHKIMGRALKLLVVMKDGRVLNKRALAQFLKNKLETYKIPTLYEQTETVKRTFNGKLDRKFYQR